MRAASRPLLGLATVAVAFAAADTYVVVLALPDMMGTIGIPIDELQRGAPIVSGFLLGYVAMLPLIGRMVDQRGRVPVLVAALLFFAAGSLLTTLAYDLSTLVAGRFLQGMGGGGLVPVTLALVADLYPAERRGVPLGLVSAVQEVGSVVGPLYGAAILAVSDWRVIFAVNLVVGLALAVLVRSAAHEPTRPAADCPLLRLDWAGVVFLAVALIAGGLVFVHPGPLVNDVTWGQLFISLIGTGRWTTPMGMVAVAATVLFFVRCATAPNPVIDVPGWWRTVRDADLLGALLLAVALAGVIVAFATAEPKVQVFAPHGQWYLVGAVGAIGVLAWHLRTAEVALVPRGALRRTAAWGSLVVSFFVGAALIAALIDIPIFARTTAYQDSQLLAALVLVRFLLAVPVGAVLGGYLTRTLPAGLVAAIGMLLAAMGFMFMSGWGLTALSQWSANVSLVVGGLGFGLALAPVNATLLVSTEPSVHGLAIAGVVVSRMVGMLVGVSALTTIGLRRYYAEASSMPPPMQVCGGTTSRCQAFDNLLRDAGIAQEHAVFVGAAACALVAGVLALMLFRSAPTRSVDLTVGFRAGSL